MRERAEIRAFLILLLVASSGFYAFAFLADDAPRRWLSVSPFFMWSPGVAALLTLVLLRGDLRGLGWSWGGARYYVLAYLLPLAFCLPVYLAVWLTGLGGFDPQVLESYRAQAGLPEGRVGTLAVVAAIAALAPLGIVATVGEELGWRGFLVPRLMALTSFTKTSLIVGIVWSLWHYPVIVAVVPHYLPRLPLWYATACFTVSVVAISFVYTWLRLRSGSVFPAALLHAASNAFQGAFEAVTRHEAATSWFTYEYGLGFALAIPLLALPFWRSGRELDALRALRSS